MRLLESDERASSGPEGLDPDKDFWIHADMKRGDENDAADVLGVCVHVYVCVSMCVCVCVEAISCTCITIHVLGVCA